MSDDGLVFTDVPHPVIRQLPGGASVIVSESRAAPHVTFRILASGGTADDPPEHAGLSSMTGGLMRAGAAGRDEPALSEELDSLAARLSAGVGRRHWEIAGDVTTLRAGHLERFLDLAADVTCRPRLEDSEFEKSRTRRLSHLRRLGDDQGGLCARAFEMTAFADHPYGNPSAGTLTTVARLGPAMIRERHAAAFGAKKGLFAMAGDISPEEAVDLLSERFGDWSATNQGPEHAAPAPVDGLRATVVDKRDPGLSQVHFRIGGPLSVRLDSPDYFAFRLAAQILGGDFTARLNQRLRVEEGLTYGARWNFTVGSRRCGAGAISTYAPAKDAVRAIRLAIEEVARFVEEGPTDDEVRDFKRKLINGFPFRFETASGIADQHLWRIREELPEDWISGYQKQIADLTTEEVHGAARRYIAADRGHLVAVGNADLAPALAEMVGGEDQVRLCLPFEFGVAEANDQANDQAEAPSGGSS